MVQCRPPLRADAAAVLLCAVAPSKGRSTLPYVNVGNSSFPPGIVLPQRTAPIVKSPWTRHPKHAIRQGIRKHLPNGFLQKTICPAMSVAPNNVAHLAFWYIAAFGLRHQLRHVAHIPTFVQHQPSERVTEGGPTGLVQRWTLANSFSI